jgi:eukaryotic-like serine/threonine-protein kinase
MESLGPYAIVGRIAKGSTADVLVARVTRTTGDEHVVIKRLWPHLATSDHFVRMFIDETSMQSLIVHPNIVRATDLGEDGETYYSVLELVDGPSLSAAVRLAPQGMPFAVAVAIGARVARALEAVHTARDPRNNDALDIVHRDVAPANVLLSREGDVKLTDFGVAKSKKGRSSGLLATEKTDPGFVKGRRTYMAPEQMRGDDDVDARADLFSLGIILWELLKTDRLYSMEDPDLVDKVTTAAPPRLTEGPPSLIELVDALLAKSPHHRPRDAKTVAEVLEQLATDGRESIAAFVQTLGLPSLELGA